MTIEDLKKLFYEYKNSDRKRKGLRRRLAEIKEDMTAISSALGNVGMPSNHSSNDPKIERLMDKAREVEKRYLAAIDEYMTAEDRLAEAFNMASLTEEEKEVLIESYLIGRPVWKIANEMGWSERTIKNRKRWAVKKICEK